MRAVKKMLPAYVFSILLTLFCTMFASQSVSALSEAAPVWSPSDDPTVVLDPGHGGEDGGAVSPNGVRESKLNLSISLRTRTCFVFSEFRLL